MISLKQKFLPSYFILKILKFVIILQTDYSVILLLVYSIKKKKLREKNSSIRIVHVTRNKQNIDLAYDLDYDLIVRTPLAARG